MRQETLETSAINLPFLGLAPAKRDILADIIEIADQISVARERNDTVLQDILLAKVRELSPYLDEEIEDPVEGVSWGEENGTFGDLPQRIRRQLTRLIAFFADDDEMTHSLIQFFLDTADIVWAQNYARATRPQGLHFQRMQSEGEEALNDILQTLTHIEAICEGKATS